MELYYPPRPKSKLEEYNLKLKERELYTNNILDRFTQNGNGAPIKDLNGNPITKRKAILEDIKYINNDPLQNEEDMNIYEEEENNIFSNNISRKQKKLEFLPVQADQFEFSPENNILNINNNDDNVQSQYQFKQNKEQQNYNKNPNTKSEEKNNYNGIGILPYVSDFPQIKQKMKLDSYKEEIAKAIEEKKIRKIKELKKQMELDLKEELKVKKALEEEQRLVKLEKKKKEDEENRSRMINLQKMENQKKKKNLIDIDEYYGKDFREFQKNKKNKIMKNTNKNSYEDTDGNNNYIGNNVYNEFDSFKNNLRTNSALDIQKTKLDTLQAINNFTIFLFS